MGIVTLITDFDLADGYVGIMHGVMHSICPNLTVVDLSHQVAPQDVRGAAYLLYAAYSYFPAGTVHCVVVDPGVGTLRRAIAVEISRRHFVAPDNGVLSYVLAREHLTAAVSLTNPRYHLRHVSRTFHGRDIFAPVAAHLACGVALADLGEPVGQLVTFPVPGLSVQPGGVLAGQVIHVDRFGNLITSIGHLLWHGDKLSLQPALPAPGKGAEASLPSSFVASEVRVCVGGQRIQGIRPTYGDAPVGEVLALIGSIGHLEIAVAGGSATQALGLGVGAEVRLEVTRR
ncbi:MAG: SAM-dependent chlorinase/fluorinase [Anaerolineae bacterium]|nr:MAG: SAM-dependent chlorinase/fluorinase [Anaerolineae bacterium]